MAENHAPGSAEQKALTPLPPSQKLREFGNVAIYSGDPEGNHAPHPGPFDALSGNLSAPLRFHPAHKARGPRGERDARKPVHPAA